MVAPMQRMLWIGFAAAVAALVVLTGVLAPIGRAGISLYVAPGGSDANSCASATLPCATINGAIGKAGAGDAVHVAAGTYTSAGSDVVVVNKSITLDGGWDSATFTTQSGVSTIDGGGVRRGLQIAPGFTATVSDFVIQNGIRPQFDAFGGGGILNDGTLTLDSSTVRNNMNSGIVTEGPLTLTNSTVNGNQSNLSSEGGGITGSTGAGVTIAITNSTITGNTQSQGGWDLPEHHQRRPAP